MRWNITKNKGKMHTVCIISSLLCTVKINFWVFRYTHIIVHIVYSHIDIYTHVAEGVWVIVLHIWKNLILVFASCLLLNKAYLYESNSTAQSILFNGHIIFYNREVLVYLAILILMSNCFHSIFLAIMNHATRDILVHIHYFSSIR